MTLFLVLIAILCVIFSTSLAYFYYINRKPAKHRAIVEPRRRGGKKKDELDHALDSYMNELAREA